MLSIEKIVITDDDIDWVESIMEGISFDESRRKVIKNLDSIDIQAFPGTGKTTVLVAKLAILAKKWPYTHRGICVLSHTNVAREEIEERLGASEIGRKLLSYPHFIGTVHSFFNTYISMPWLKSNDIGVDLIDTDIVLQRRVARIPRKTKFALEQRGLSIYCCEAIDIPVKIDIKCGEHTDTYKKVQEIVAASHESGEFTFQELLLYAKHILGSNSSIKYSVIDRFPLLFIDEAQDTSEFQWGLIDSAFSSKEEVTNNIRQGFGDCNQAIFSSYTSSENTENYFPRTGFLTINDSKRFNHSISSAVDSLSVYQAGMIGSSTEFNHITDNKIIFLFEKSKSSEVLDAYSKYILQNFSDEELLENSKGGIHAVGMVHTGEALASDDKKFPSGILDYYSGYESSYYRKKENPLFLIDYFRYGEYFFSQSKESYLKVDYYAKGILKIIEYANNKTIRTSSTVFASLCKQLKDESSLMFRIEFEKLQCMDFSNSDEWKDVLDFLAKMLQKFFCIKMPKIKFLDWNDATLPITEVEMLSDPNKYTFFDENTNRKLEVFLSSIHAEKGRTHLATLVFETFWYDHNIKSILPWLLANPPKTRGSRNSSRLKCHYVALTRAKALIAIAIPKNQLDDSTIQSIECAGWKIIEI